MAEPLRPLVYVGGVFDLFHYGHARFLQSANAFGRVVVAVNTDDFVASYKRRPVMNLWERMEMVRQCRYVWKAIVNFGNEDSRPAILTVHPTYIAHGDDWTGDSYYKIMGFDQEWLDDNGIKMLYLPYTKSVSTTDIIGRCQPPVGLVV
jgi:glycerol-3-phosphate cytidylyltransferase